jgi:hypothetical protein
MGYMIREIRWVKEYSDKEEALAECEKLEKSNPHNAYDVKEV